MSPALSSLVIVPEKPAQPGAIRFQATAESVQTAFFSIKQTPTIPPQSK